MQTVLSIIIPVFNESKTIEDTIRAVFKNLSKEIETEMILVDGGSEDSTVEKIKESISNSFEGENNISVHLLHSPKGRAKQMNFGAQNTKGEILYFLHADSIPPKDFDKYILKEVINGNPAGCFRMKFDSNHWWLMLAGWLTRFNWKMARGGDQSQFITKDLFKDIGGFDENYIIYEDNILISELYKRKRFTVIPHSLTTSARRYRKQGIWNLQYHFWMVHLKRRLGADADELYDYYSKHIVNMKT